MNNHSDFLKKNLKSDAPSIKLYEKIDLIIKEIEIKKTYKDNSIVYYFDNSLIEYNHVLLKVEDMIESYFKDIDMIINNNDKEIIPDKIINFKEKIAWNYFRTFNLYKFRRSIKKESFFTTIQKTISPLYLPIMLTFLASRYFGIVIPQSNGITQHILFASLWTLIIIVFLSTTGNIFSVDEISNKFKQDLHSDLSNRAKSLIDNIFSQERLLLDKI